MKLLPKPSARIQSFTNPVKKLWLATLISACGSQMLHAADYTVDVGLSRTYNDNATLTNTARTDDENAVFTNFSLEHEGKTASLQMGYNIEYTDYEDDTNSDDLKTNGSSLLNITVIPERIQWFASHLVKRYLFDRNNVDISDNQETRQSFSTGPQITFPITKTGDIQLTGQYSKNTFEQAENVLISTGQSDTESLKGSVRYIHSLSAISQFNVAYSYTRLDYDLISPIAQFQSYSAGYSSELASGAYTLQIGSNTSSFGAEPEKTGLFLALTFDREFSGQTLAINTSRKLSDSTQNFESYIATFNNFTQQNIDIQDTVEKTIFSIEYGSTNHCRTCKYGVSFTYVEDDFTSDINSIRDEQTMQYRAFYTHNFSKKLTGSVAYSLVDSDFINANIEDEEDRYEMHMDWKYSEKLSVQFRSSYAKRDNESTIDHDQIIASLGVTYNLFDSK